jgi:hypothetical protein
MMRKLVIFCLAIGVTCTSATLAFAQPGTTSFQIFIPRKVSFGGSPAPFPQIGVVHAIVSMTSANPVTFTITDPNNVSHVFPGLVPGGMTRMFTFGNGDPASNDTVSVTPQTDPNDPDRYELDFILRSDSQPDCTGAQTKDPNMYTVQVGMGVTDPRITGVCLDSYDGRYRSVPINNCSNMALGANLIPIPLDDPADKVASLDAAHQPTAGCFTQRPPVDVVLVLDKSGSMASPTTSGLGATRMDALHTATTNFVNVWDSLCAASWASQVRFGSRACYFRTCFDIDFST